MTRTGAGVVLEVCSLSVRYGSRVALQELSFRVHEAEVLLVTGTTGCGKSTLALACSGLIPHAQEAQLSGRVTVDGLDTAAHPPHELSVRAGLVFQNPATQLFHSSVEEETDFAPRNIGLGEEEIRRRTSYALAATGISHLRGRSTRALSMGEKQRLAIASILSLKPKILILDEPTANLDRGGVRQVVSALQRLNREQGVTILVFEHRLAAFYPWATRVMVLENGKLAADGLAHDPHLRGMLARLGLEQPEPAAGKRSVILLRRAVAPGSDAARPLVRLEGIDAGYGARICLRGLDLALYPGELAALVGANGAGKSTLARVLTGMLRPKKGKLRWDPALKGLPLGRRVGFLHHEVATQLFFDTVREEIAFAPRNFRLRVQEQVERSLAATDLHGLSARMPCCLSAGEQQRTALAATLSADPRLLILDEPTVGQDWIHLEALMRYLAGLKREGKSILVITHDDRLVRRFADRILHLRGGRIAVEAARGCEDTIRPSAAAGWTAVAAQAGCVMSGG